MRITRTVHLVGSGRAGFSLTDPFDCHVYLLDGGSELALIDAGAGRDLPALLARVEEAGFDPMRIAKVFITHGHADHAGGAADLHTTCGTTVLASPEVATWLRTADEKAISLDVARAAGGYPGDYRLRPVPNVMAIRGGDAVQVGSLQVAAVEANGHSRGHLAYLVDDGTLRSLFTGDALFFGGRILLQNIWDCSLEASLATVKRFAELTFEGFFPGHLSFSVHDGYRHVETALGYLKQVLPPPQMVI